MEVCVGGFLFSSVEKGGEAWGRGKKHLEVSRNCEIGRAHV